MPDTNKIKAAAVKANTPKKKVKNKQNKKKINKNYIEKNLEFDSNQNITEEKINKNEENSLKLENIFKKTEEEKNEENPLNLENIFKEKEEEKKEEEEEEEPLFLITNKKDIDENEYFKEFQKDAFPTVPIESLSLKFKELMGIDPKSGHCAIYLSHIKLANNQNRLLSKEILLDVIKITEQSTLKDNKITNNFGLFGNNNNREVCKSIATASLKTLYEKFKGMSAEDEYFDIYISHENLANKENQSLSKETFRLIIERIKQEISNKKEKEKNFTNNSDLGLFQNFVENSNNQPKIVETVKIHKKNKN